MRFFSDRLTGDLFIMTTDQPEWCNVHTDGRYSRATRTPMYCRLVPTKELALVHVVQWKYKDDLSEISEEEAKLHDADLVHHIIHMKQPRFSHRTKQFAVLEV